MKKRWTTLSVALLGVLMCATVAVAEIAKTKDNGTAMQNVGMGLDAFVDLEENICDQLVELYGEATYKGYLSYSNGNENVFSILADNEKIGWHIIDNNGNVEPYNADEHAYVFQTSKAEDKITDELQALMEEDSAQSLSVYVWRADIDAEQVVSSMPATVSVASYTRNSETDVQGYLREKRSYYADAYTSYNASFLNEYFGSEISALSVAESENAQDEIEQIEFVSSFSPMCVLNISAEQILSLAQDDTVVEIGYMPDVEIVFEAAAGRDSIQGTYVRENYGYTGSGVAVGIIDEGYLKSIDELQGVNYENCPPSSGLAVVTSEHTTRVATIIAGQTSGLAPDCKLYIAPVVTYMDILNAVETLVEKGVSVINVSLGIKKADGTPYEKEYSVYDKWFDHINMNHDVLVVKSAGNYENVTTPGMAYNVVTVGAYDDNLTPTNHTDDCFMILKLDTDGDGKYDRYPISGHLENDGLAVKPDLMAPGVLIEVDGLDNDIKYSSGTSFAAPYVTGTVAQMLHAKPALATHPGQIKSILLASAWRKMEEEWYQNSYMSDVEGAGKVDSKNAIYVASQTRYTYEYQYATQFPYRKTITLDASESQIRVALCWLKQSVHTQGSTNHENMGVSLVRDELLSDLDLYIFGPDGNLVYSSKLPNGNVEIAEFDPTVTGTYTIEVRRISGTTDVDFIYLAWW